MSKDEITSRELWERLKRQKVSRSIRKGDSYANPAILRQIDKKKITKARKFFKGMVVPR